MQPVKVLYCIDSLVRGGTELQLIGLIERLDRDKYTPYLLTIRDSDPGLVPKDCHYLNWSVPSLVSAGGVSSLVKLVSLLKGENIRIVQTFFQDSTIFGGLAARLANVPVRVASFRDMGFWHTSIQGFVLKKIYSLMTGYICNADIIKTHFSSLYAVDEDKIKIIRNGIDTEKLTYIEHSEDTLHIGIVGNMTRHVKRIDLFIGAAAIVSKRFPSIQWHIIGDGHLIDELKSQAKINGITDQCSFTGRIDNVVNYLEKLQVGVICSDSEGLSNAILEYMFKGVTAVVTDVGGNPELVRDGETGLLVPPDDEQGLAEALIRLIEDNTLRVALAKNARQAVERDYGWHQCLVNHDSFYQSQFGPVKKGASL
ncbi:glycosyltransferase [Alkalimarinus coralli]|uniref:glycosyltransferase n=1 Tax=Alkalimarinus coralli TaxID=2935863 RepID=UPI00202B0A78|nr:glycosyltransferase [Alkalimarinus coralli]